MQDYTTPVDLFNPDAVVDALRPVLEAGGYVFPCEQNGKKPRLKWREHSTNNPEQVRAWAQMWPGSNWGLDIGKSGFAAVDQDTKHGQTGPAEFAALAEVHGGYPKTWEAITTSGGKHTVFANRNGLNLRNSQSNNLMRPGVETRGEGGYIVIFPSQVDGKPYLWLVGPCDLTPAEVPGWLAAEWQARQEGQAKPSAEPSQEWPKPKRGSYWLKRALEQAKHGSRNNTGYWLALQLRDDGYEFDEAAPYMTTYAGGVPQSDDDPYTEREALESLKQAYSKPRRKPAGRLWDMEPPSIPMSELLEAEDKDELGYAVLFAKHHEGLVCYDPNENKYPWYFYTGTHWEQDKTGRVLHLITNHVAGEYYKAAGAALQADNKEQSKKMLDAGKRLRRWHTAENILTQAKDFLKMRGKWDERPYLLACPNGVLNLKTLEFEPVGDPHDYLRAYCVTEWRGINEPAPLWEKTFAQIHAGNQAVMAFVQRLYGLGLTGESARFLPILWGEGANGKTTESRIITEVLGGELVMSGVRADVLMDTFRRNPEGPSPFAASLMGKRIVMASESEAGANLNGAMVKQFTGQDPRTARKLHSDPVTYDPTDIIFMLTNHKPHLSAEDQALWDRLLLIPYTERFVENPDPEKPNEHERDAFVTEKLRAEAPGILAWMARGYQEYLRVGLNAPAEVKEATQEYRKGENLLDRFLAETCEVEPDAFTYTADLTKAFSLWAKANRVRQNLSPTQMGMELTNRGYKKEKNRKGSFYWGLRLLTVKNYDEVDGNAEGKASLTPFEEVMLQSGLSM